MPLSFIKAVPIKKSPGLRKLLHRQLAGTEPGRSFKNLHASDVTHPDYQFCARERAYQHSLKKQPKIGFLSTSENVTYDIGRFVEAKIIDTFAEAGMAVGDWKCRHCGTTAKFRKRPFKCEECEHRHFDYKELRALSDVTGVSCGLDLLLHFPGQAKHRVVEIKSIDKDEFKTLVAPKAEHGQRTKLYLKCVAESSAPWADKIYTDYGYVVYVSKGGYGCACEEVPLWEFKDAAFSPFKDFIVQRDDEGLKPVLAQVLIFQEWFTAWKAAQESEKDVPLPELPERLCASSLDKRAKKCSCLAPCFIKTLQMGKAKDGQSVKS